MSASPTHTVFGVHTGPAGVGADELRATWARVEELPFDWISIWDHFWSADGVGTACFEGVAVHTALAMSTQRVRCGSLVYCAAFRHPAVLANAMAAIDRFSAGRCEVGIGAGWDEAEFVAHGVEFASTRDRLDMLEEYVVVLKGLLGGERFSHEGRYFTLADAVCDPAPLQSPLPLWVGGGGERRTLRIAARHADGWNVPFVDPATFAHKNRVLDDRCAEADRDPAAITRSVNLALASDEDALRQRFGVLADYVRPAAVVGSAAEMADRIAQYVEAGAGQVNLALRAPYEPDALETAAVAIDSLR